MVQQKIGSIDEQTALSFCPRTDYVGIAAFSNFKVTQDLETDTATQRTD